jgi:hypothetical protein
VRKAHDVMPGRAHTHALDNEGCWALNDLEMNADTSPGWWAEWEVPLCSQAGDCGPFVAL